MPIKNLQWPLAKWHGPYLCQGDKMYAVVAHGVGGLKVGVWDGTGDTQRDGVPRLHWMHLRNVDCEKFRRELNRGASQLQPIPDDVDLRP